MIINSISSEELEKSKSNSPEEFFNRSEVTYTDEKGKSKTLSVLYVRFFDEKVSEYTPYDSDPLFEVNGRPIYVRDVVAMLALQKHPEYQSRHRVYINEEESFASLFEGMDISELEEKIMKLETDGQLQLTTAQ